MMRELNALHAAIVTQHATQAQADDMLNALVNLLKLAEEHQVSIEDEFGTGRTLLEIENAGELRSEIIAARAAIAAQKGGCDG